MKSSKDLENNLLTELKPASWELLRLKYLFKEINERSERGDEDLLTVSQFTGVTKTSESVGDNELVTNAETLEGYKKVSKNDLVFNIMLAWNGSLGIADTDGIVSPAYCVYRLRHNDNPKYFHYLFRTNLFKGLFKINSTGVVDSRLRLYPDKFFALRSLHPPRKEQDAIVKFLDEKIADIDKYISAKQKLIALLNEQKAAIINQAVTKGIDQNVKMKDSRVEWLGDVPKHWEIKPLKHWVYMNQEKLSEDIEPNYEFEYLDIGNVQTGKIVGEIEKFKFENAPSRARRIVRNGDTIISTVRTYLKAVLYIDKYSEKYIVSTGFAVLTPRKIISPYFLYLAVQNNPFISMVTAKSVGASYPAINPTTLGTLKLAAPYDVTEQLKIIKFINAEFIPIEKNIDSIQSQINLMESYKISLIAEAVTGKLKIT